MEKEQIETFDLNETNMLDCNLEAETKLMPDCHVNNFFIIPFKKMDQDHEECPESLLFTPVTLQSCSPMSLQVVQTTEKTPHLNLVGVHKERHSKSDSNENNHSGLLCKQQSNVTPEKFQERSRCMSPEKQSPVLGSTVTSGSTFHSSTPANSRVKTFRNTPEFKKSVLNILDKLCSPISTMKSQGETSLGLSTKNSEENEILTSDTENELYNEACKNLSTDNLEIDKNSQFNDSTNKNKLDNLSINHHSKMNDLFNDISDVSLQVLCEATSKIVDSSKTNHKSNHLTNRPVSSGYDKYMCGAELNKETISELDKELIVTQYDKKYSLCKADGNIFECKKLIYSGASFHFDTSPRICLNNIFSEAKCLEEANKYSKKEDSKHVSKKEFPQQVQNKCGTVNINSRKISRVESLFDFDHIESNHKPENTMLNDSIGITDTQFCEAIEAAEIISNFDSSQNNSIVNASGKSRDDMAIDDNVEDFSISCDKTYLISNKILEEKQLYNNKKLLTGHHSSKENDSIVGSRNNLILMRKSPNKSLGVVNFSDCDEVISVGNQNKDFLLINGENIIMLNKNSMCGKDENLDKTFNRPGDDKILRRFQTGNGEDKEIREKLLTKVKPLHGAERKTEDRFRTEILITGSSNNLLIDPCFFPNATLSEFQTASGKSVKIAEDLLKKAKHLFQDDFNITEAPLQGFQTASGNSVKISEDSLKKAKHLLQDDFNIREVPLKGFQTASGNSVKISEDSLKKAKHLFQDDFNIPEAPLQGFQTASGRSVKISGESLKKVKQSNQDDFNIPEVPLKGFQTAIGNSVKIAEDSLKKAKHLLQDDFNIPEAPLQGFQTASGKSVKISEDSLKKAKHLLQDDFNIPEAPLQGFQTASGKSVKISEDSLKIAKHLLQDDFNIPEAPLQGFQTASGKSVKISEESLKKEKQSNQDDFNIPEAPLQGFQTASGKSVKISEDSLKIAKHLLQDDFNIPEAPLQGFQTASGKSVKISEESLKKEKQSNQDDFNIPEAPLQGFQTASGKIVKISEESLKKVKQSNQDAFNIPEITLKGFQTASGKSVKISEELLKKVKQSNQDDFNIPEVPLKGFQTASGKSVKISEDSLKKAKHFLQDDFNVPEAPLQGFQTASGKSVKISEDSLKKAKHFLQDDFNVPEGPLQGFQTASGKSVKISEDSLKKAKHFLQDDFKIPEAPLQGFQTASGKSVTLSEDSLKKAKHLLQDDFDIPDAPLQEFQTASRKSVKISEDSLEKARHLLQDDFNIPEAALKEFQTASGKSVKISEDSLKKAKYLLQDDFHIPEGPLQGFQTASGKSVKISEDSLKKAKHFLQDDFKIPEAPLQGFQTASGKSVTLSEDSLKKAKHLLQDDFDIPDAPLQGFQTASRKSVKISEDSLEKARHLLQDDFNIPEAALKEFQTASGKSVKISEELLKKVKQSNQDDFNIPEVPLKGFQTASGKSVKISEELLKKVKQSNQDDFNIPEVPLKGFQTASGKSVKISEDSLKKAKHFLQDDFNVPEAPLQGFQTASGKSVKISEDSLKKAKHLLQDDFDIPDAPLQGFQTASGNSVKISEDSLEKARHLLQDDFNIPEAALKEFLTASGKSVKISVDSLGKARHLLQDDINVPEIPRMAFQTASGKSVKISEESLKESKHVFDSDNHESEFLLQGYHTQSESTVDFSSDVQCLGELVLSNDQSERKNRQFCYDEQGLKSAINDVLSKSAKCDHVIQETICSLCNNNFLTQNISQTDIGRKGIENQKRKFDNISDFSRQLGEKPGNSNLDVTLSSLDKNNERYHRPTRKRRKLFSDMGNSIRKKDHRLYDMEEICNSVVGTSVISETDLSMLNHSTTRTSQHEDHNNVLHSPSLMSPSVAREVSESMAALLADEESCSPFSLKPFLTSPAMVFDRQVSLPPINCYENEVYINDEQLSPILDNQKHLKEKKYVKHSTDGLSTPVTHLNKNVALLKTSSNLNPPATSTPIESQLQSKLKRKSSPAKFDIQTEKRQKIDHFESKTVIDRVVEARSEAALNQEKCIQQKCKNPEAIKPCKGLYLLRKTSEKRISLQELAGSESMNMLTTEQLSKMEIKKCVLEVTIKNVMDFKFTATDYFCKEVVSSNVSGIAVGDGALLIPDREGKIGVKEVTRAFLASPSVDPSLISPEWVANHFKWIVLKMASMERAFPREWGNRCLTPNNLILQMKYRYDREIDSNQRPALRKILEKDESGAKPMVLFVADIISVPVENQTGKEKSGERREVELSDGWYSVRSVIDHEMEALIRKGKVNIGTKLFITGAELINNDGGCHPLEMPADVRLRVSTNSIRRARWYARLGFHPRGLPPLRLRQVLGRGGTIPALIAVVARTYPVLFLEKAEGKTVIRSERAEQLVCDEYQTKRQQCAESILSQLQRDLEKTKNKKKHPVTRNSVKQAKSTNDLLDLLEGVEDISIFQDVLSKDQLDAIQEQKEKEMRKVQQNLQKKFVKQLDEKLAPRNVTRMLKVRLVEEGQTDRSALLTVWNPSDDVMSYLTEENSLIFYNISASGYSRFGDLQLTAGKQTKYSLVQHCACPRRTTCLKMLQDSELKPQFSEVDVVGMVLHLPDEASKLIYLADADYNFIGVSFWTDLKATGYTSVLTPGSLIAASNLHWRSNLVTWKLPSAFATEMSTFSQHPRKMHLQEALAQLRSLTQALDLEKYMSSCLDRIKSLLAQRSTAGLGSVTSAIDGPEQSVDIKKSSCHVPEAALKRSLNTSEKLSEMVVDSNLNLNTDTPTSRRLEMLDMYGEPPPISPLAVSMPSSLKRSFRPPTRKLTEKR